MFDFDMVPYSAQRDEIEGRVGEGFIESWQAVTKPSDSLGWMQAHARLAQFTDRLHRQYFVALAREPGGIATGSGTDISNPDRTDGQ